MYIYILYIAAVYIDSSFVLIYKHFVSLTVSIKLIVICSTKCQLYNKYNNKFVVLFSDLNLYKK